ncbi:AP2 domain transcription factor AP2VIIa-3 [Besnoitia besnoiti]|uniref:AP2 domain transcription factor AP2VIIa-3 n=1 Tax=Besnoitia besnoiti TaxID=94643 RepID=A0A2A9MDL4_BESBE|nr:AP2 domain transcription factor AP2VIIa-3 [Besnoitia besnoiti]PFH35969.1 AP2 domain transcription factor AP2VIIa-3 [Besnoitia besnoiti]
MQKSSFVWRAAPMRPAPDHSGPQTEKQAGAFDSQRSSVAAVDRGLPSRQLLTTGFLPASDFHPAVTKIVDGEVLPKVGSLTGLESLCRDAEFLQQEASPCRQGSVRRDASMPSMTATSSAFDEDSKPARGDSLSVAEGSTVDCSLPPLSRLCSISLLSADASPASAYISTSGAHPVDCVDGTISCGFTTEPPSVGSTGQPSEECDSPTFHSASTVSTPPELFPIIAAKLMGHPDEPRTPSACMPSHTLAPGSPTPDKHGVGSSDTAVTTVCSERTGSGGDGVSALLESKYADKVAHLPCAVGLRGGSASWCSSDSTQIAEGGNLSPSVQVRTSYPDPTSSCEEDGDAADWQSSAVPESERARSFFLSQPPSRDEPNDPDGAALVAGHAPQGPTTARELSSLDGPLEPGIVPQSTSSSVTTASETQGRKGSEPEDSCVGSSDSRGAAVVVPRGVWYNRSTCCWIACVSGVGKRLYVFSAKRLGFERARQLAVDCKNGCLMPDDLEAAADDNNGGGKATSSLAGGKSSRAPTYQGKSVKCDKPITGTASIDPAGSKWAHSTGDGADRALARPATKSPSCGEGIVCDGVGDDASTAIETPGILSRTRSADCSQEVTPPSEENLVSKETSPISSLVAERAPRKRVVSRRVAETRATSRTSRVKAPSEQPPRQDDCAVATSRVASKGANRAGTPHGVWFNSHTKSWTCATVGPRRQLLVFSSARYGFDNARAMAIEARMQSVQALQEHAPSSENLQCRSSRAPAAKEDNESASWRPKSDPSNTQTVDSVEQARSSSEETIGDDISDMGTPHRSPRFARPTSLSDARPASVCDDSSAHQGELSRCASVDAVEAKQLTDKEQQLLCVGRLAARLVLSDLLEVCLPQLPLSPASFERARSAVEVALWTVSSAQHPAQMRNFLRLFDSCFHALKTPSNMPSQTKVHLLEVLTGAALEFVRDRGSVQDDMKKGAPVHAEEQLEGDRKRQKLEDGLSAPTSAVTTHGWVRRPDDLVFDSTAAAE